MTGLSRLLLRIARWIAGPHRAEWIDAMESEAASTSDNSAAWAAGCLLASIKDRLRRDRPFISAVLLFPFCILAVATLIFLPVVKLSELLDLPGWTFIVVNLLLPFPFAFGLGRLRPGRPAFLALPFSFFLCEMAPVALMWVEFGTSPLSFFGPKGHWYNMSPALGLSCAFAVWIAGAWLGTRSARKRAA